MSDPRERAISEHTPIRLALAIGFCSVFGAAVWWAASVQSDLNAIKISLVNDRSRFVAVEGIDARLKMVETYGSPRVHDLEKRMLSFEREFELHKAQCR